MKDLSNIQYIIGIDFGHGETAAEFCNLIDGNVDVLEILNGVKGSIPSIFWEPRSHESEQILLGEGICHKLIHEEDGFYEGFKCAPTNATEEQKKAMITFMREVYCRIRANYNQFTDDNHLVFIAIPSNHENWNSEAEQLYFEMAKEAGLPIMFVQTNGLDFNGVIRESRAAYYSAMQDSNIPVDASQSILIVDFGSSTIDLTFYADEESPIDDGSRFGAHKVEESILLALEKDPKPSWRSFDMEYSVADIKACHEKPNLYKRALYGCRSSKEAFYRNISSLNYLEFAMKMRSWSEGEIKTNADIYLYEDEIENLLSSFKADVKKYFEDFKNKHLTDKTINALVLTGGASRMPFVKEIAKEVFGLTSDRIYRAPDPSLTVADGITRAGCADVHLYQLLNKMLSFEKVTNPSIANSVIDKIKDNVASEAISILESEYKEFKDGYTYSTNSIETLESRIKSRLTQINVTGEIAKAYKTATQSYIGSTIKGQFGDYVVHYFPKFNIELLTSTADLSIQPIQLSIQETEELKSIISDSIESIAMGILEASCKIVLGIFVATGVIGILALRNIGVHAINILKYIFVDHPTYLERASYDDALEEIFNDPFWNGKSRNDALDADGRRKVYDKFSANKSDYKSRLISEINDKLDYNNEFKETLNKACREEAERYIINEVNHIRTLLK